MDIAVDASFLSDTSFLLSALFHPRLPMPKRGRSERSVSVRWLEMSPVHARVVAAAADARPSAAAQVPPADAPA
jgi:hypothetical protein